MIETFDIQADPRSDLGKGASRRLRRAGKVPAIIYGGHQEPEMIAVDHNDILAHLRFESFYSHILNLKIGERAQQVILKDIQRHPAKPFVTHMDFQRVSADEKIRTHVPVHFVNESSCPGVKMGGVVSHHLTDLEVSCLPKDLPEFIEADMGAMQLGDIIHVRDLKLADGVEVTHIDPETAVVSVHNARGTGEEAEGESEA